MTILFDGRESLIQTVSRKQIDEWCETFDDPDEERQFIDELYRCGLDVVQIARVLKAIGKRFEVVK